MTIVLDNDEDTMKIRRKQPPAFVPSPVKEVLPLESTPTPSTNHLRPPRPSNDNNRDSSAIRASVFDVLLELGVEQQDGMLAEWILSDPSTPVREPTNPQRIRFQRGESSGSRFRERLDSLGAVDALTADNNDRGREEGEKKRGFFGIVGRNRSKSRTRNGKGKEKEKEVKDTKKDDEKGEKKSRRVSFGLVGLPFKSRSLTHLPIPSDISSVPPTPKRKEKEKKRKTLALAHDITNITPSTSTTDPPSHSTASTEEWQTMSRLSFPIPDLDVDTHPRNPFLREPTLDALNGDEAVPFPTNTEPVEAPKQISPSPALAQGTRFSFRTFVVSGPATHSSPDYDRRASEGEVKKRRMTSFTLRKTVSRPEGEREKAALPRSRELG